jgi:S-adenosylmethionine hydrolase
VFVLFTDFSWNGPYVGQMKAELVRRCPNVPVVDLMHDAPPFNAQASAYLLAAYSGSLPDSAVIVAVVDPGVGGKRNALAIQADRRWLVGPDNGLLTVLARRAERLRAWVLPIAGDASATFHGRDVFAPAAADISAGRVPAGREVAPAELVGWDWPDELAEVLYVDRYGNAVTGIHANNVPSAATIEVRGRRLPFLPTFGAAAVGECFWYGNSSGLVELAANQDSAARVLGLRPGDAVALHVRPSTNLS